MENVGDAQRQTAIALRLIFGSLIATAGLFIIGGLLSSPSASAAEPTPTGPSLLGGITSAVGSLDGTVSSVVGSTTSIVNSVVSPSAKALPEALPAPVGSVVSTVIGSVAPTVTSVAHVAQSGIVSQVVSPLAGVVDNVIGAVPGANQLLGANPIGAILSPTTGLVDSAVGSIVGTVAGAISDAGGTVISPAGPPSGGTPGNSVTGATPFGEPALSASATSTAGFLTGTADASTLGAIVSPQTSTPGGDPATPGAPGNTPFALSSPGASGESSGPGSGPGGISSSAGIDSGSYGTGLAAGVGGSGENDVLPSSPASHHDSTPD